MGTTMPIVVPPPFSGDGDQARLIWMLTTIQVTLDFLVRFNPPGEWIAPEQKQLLESTWPEASAALEKAIFAVQNNFPNLQPALLDAGMHGPMLQIKGDSLQRCVEGMYREVPATPVESIWGSKWLKWLKWLKPTTKCINTILGSLLRAVPGVEVAKEWKDHWEVAVGVAEAVASN